MNIAGFVLGIIGSATGLVSFVFLCINYSRKKTNLVIEEHNEYSSFYFEATPKINKKFKTAYCAGLSLAFSNCSAYPITISMIEIMNSSSRRKYPHRSDFKIDPIRRFVNHEGPYISYEFAPPLELTLRIEPYDSHIACICLPFFDSFLKDDSQPVEVIINIKTPRRTIPHKIKIFNLDIIHRERYPESINIC